jgi:hypothetical protein
MWWTTQFLIVWCGLLVWGVLGTSKVLTYDPDKSPIENYLFTVKAYYFVVFHAFVVG